MADPTQQDSTQDDAAFFEHVMALVAARGWRRLSLGDIAEETGLSLGALRQRYGDKQGILGAFTRHIDDAVLEGKIDQDDSVRDRLFDLLMRRFDALRPYRDGLAVIVREGGGGGLVDALCSGQRLMKSLAWTLEAAGVSSSGFVGRARTKGLALVYASTFFTWLRDDSEDQSRTMAALDRNLARAERFANMSPGWSRRAHPDPAADPGADSGAGGGPPTGGAPGPGGTGGNAPAGY